jgi:hypothetical protein
MPNALATITASTSAPAQPAAAPVPPVTAPIPDYEKMTFEQKRQAQDQNAARRR